jgi:putative ABC transport system ATP-binding protein
VLFELQSVSLSRNGATVLDGVTASIRTGSSCLAGPSGSGKSTLLRLLNRLVDPETGNVLYRGADLRQRDVLELRREVCLVPQLPALIEGTVGENIGLGCRLAGREAPAADQLLGLAGLDSSFADRDASRLSVGEQQRVMLARALALEPKVLLLDEPTSALDDDSREAVEATLLALRERLDLAVVLVTHDLDQARRMADWVVRLDRGRVVAEGSTDEVLG